jgi:uncharacterized protein
MVDPTQFPVKEQPANDNTTDGKKTACSICGKPQLTRFKPFCSKRCADVDLNRWLTGSYAIPITEDPQSSEGEKEY